MYIAVKDESEAKRRQENIAVKHRNFLFKQKAVDNV